MHPPAAQVNNLCYNINMVLSTLTPTIQYSTGDGQPVAESYIHFWAIATTAQVLTQYIPSPESKPRYREQLQQLWA
jgi:hypothetical protein